MVGVQSCQETVSATPLVGEEGCGRSLPVRTAASRRLHFCATQFPADSLEGSMSFHRLMSILVKLFKSFSYDLKKKNVAWHIVYCC